MLVDGCVRRCAQVVIVPGSTPAADDPEEWELWPLARSVLVADGRVREE